MGIVHVTDIKRGTVIFTVEPADFWRRVKKSSKPNGCWEWTGSTSDGYGIIHKRDNDRSYHLRVHRVAWEMRRGKIPADKFVLHRCDNRRCVRLKHLFLGTYLDNVRDMMAKGRHWCQTDPAKARYYRSGERHYGAKLRLEQVRVIRKIIAWFPRANYRNIARLFGVGFSTIYGIKCGKSWRHEK